MKPAIERYKTELKRLDAKLKRLHADREKWKRDVELQARRAAKREIELHQETAQGHREQLGIVVRERTALKCQLKVQALRIEYLEDTVRHLTGLPPAQRTLKPEPLK